MASFEQRRYEEPVIRAAALMRARMGDRKKRRSGGRNLSPRHRVCQGGRFVIDDIVGVLF